MQLLTKREKQCLDFIKSFIDKNGYAPTLRQIAKGMRLKSSDSTHKYVHRLQEKQRIRLAAKYQRNLIVEVLG